MSLIRLPGLIDPHVHLRDMGEAEKEDFFTGTSAALAGGYTTIIDMPNNKIPITTQGALGEKISVARERILCDVGFYFGSLGDNFEEFENVSSKVMGLKLFLNQTTGNYLLNPEKLEQIFLTWPKNLPILFHAENDAFDIVLDVLLKNPRRIHLCHLSTKYELQKIIEAKEKRLPVSCGVTPHHLFLTEDDQRYIGSNGLMKPPLKTKADVTFIWQHLSAIDIIESDHAPHATADKQGDNPSYGVPGLDTTLPLLLTAVSENRLSIEQVIHMCYEKPAALFGIQQDKETYSEVDIQMTYEIKNEDLFTKCKWSPFNGWKVKGKVISTYIRGIKAYENGTILANPGFGKIITPQ